MRRNKDLYEVRVLGDDTDVRMMFATDDVDALAESMKQSFKSRKVRRVIVERIVGGVTVVDEE